VAFLRVLTGKTGLGLATVGVAATLALVSGPSFAQAQAGAPAPAADPAAAKIEKGRQVFTDFGCGSCHSLGDAGATGHVGPSLDGNNNLNEALVIERVANGAGQMPAFGGQLNKDEIADLAAYVVKVAGR
jgi:mono/diheme cytochrome c family protein